MRPSEVLEQRDNAAMPCGIYGNRCSYVQRGTILMKPQISSFVKKMPFIIAEIGVNHNGDLSLALKLIEEAGKCGADAVKFQTFSADRLVTEASPKAPYQIRNTGSSQTQYAMLKSLELPVCWYPTLLEASRERGLKFISTPYDVEDIKLLQQIGVDAIKVPSAWAVEQEYLSVVARAGVPVLLSTGMCTIAEVADAVSTITQYTQDLTILQCTTNYPTAPGDSNVLVIKTLADTFGYPVGLSDHSQSHIPSVMAVALGACVIERHFTLDKSLSGPDHSSSDNPEEFSSLVRDLRSAEEILGRPEKRPVPSEVENLSAMRRSIVATEYIGQGSVILPQNVTLKRPSKGIEPRFLDLALGARALCAIYPGEHITFSMLDADTSRSLQLHEISSYLREELESLFSEITACGDDTFFHPHPFSPEYAETLCAYQGRDYYGMGFCAGEIVGYAMLRGWDEGFSRPTVGIYIRPKWRKKGLASLMLQLLLPEAKQRGATEVMAKVYAENTPSRKAFASAGYEVLGEEDGVVYYHAPVS